jgi:hypothetical protein
MRQLSLLLWSWIETSRNLCRARLWGPFLAFALIQCLAVLLLTQFHRPLLSALLVPVIQIFGGEGIMHYPAFFMALPTLFSRTSLVLDLLFGAWLFGAAFLFFWQADRPTEPERGGLGRATRAWGVLIGGRLPVTAGLVLVIFILPLLLVGDQEAMSGNQIRAFRYGTILLGSIVEALFLYVALAILVEGRGVFRAIERSVHVATRIPLATLGAVLIPNLVQIPIAYVLRHSQTIAFRLSPEMVAWAIVLGVLAYTAATFYIVGAGARLFRVQTEGEGV